MHKYPGIFIVFEGPEGSGKTSQIRLLTAYLENLGFDVLATYEPGGNPISQQIRNVILDKAHHEMSPIAEALLFHAARAQHVKQTIIPALKAGKVVICDRYQASSFAYQGVALGLGVDLIRQLGDIACQGVLPDVTLYLDVDVEVGLARKAIQGDAENNRMEAQTLAFHELVRRAYLKLAEVEGETWVTIDTEEGIEEVTAAIHAAISRVIDL